MLRLFIGHDVSTLLRHKDARRRRREEGFSSSPSSPANLNAIHCAGAVIAALFSGNSSNSSRSLSKGKKSIQLFSSVKKIEGYTQNSSQKKKGKIKSFSSTQTIDPLVRCLLVSRKNEKRDRDKKKFIINNNNIKSSFSLREGRVARRS